MTRVFVSSTYLDNIERRKQVEDAILRIRMLPVGMERFTARAEGVVALSQGEAQDCDVYVCIVAHRYGSIDGESGLSITELEYDAATAASKPRLMFEIDQNVPVLAEQDFDPGEDRWKKQEKLAAFKKKYRSAKLTPTFFKPDNLGILIYQALNEWQGPGKAEPPTGAESEQHLELWLQSYLPAVQSQYEAQLQGSRLNPGEQNNPSFEPLMEEAAEPKEDVGTNDDHVQSPKVWRLDEYLETVQAPLLLIGEGGSGKTTALLLAAARAAQRRLTDPGSPIPIYVDVSRVTKSSEFADVAAMLSGSIPFVADAGELSRYLARRNQRFLILIDSFNEIATDARRTLATSLARFVQSQGREHLLVIGSRKVAELDVIAKAPVGVRRCEVLRLQPDRVREHMERYQLAERFDALPQEVQGLAGNLFMFFAIVRTLSRGKDLPTNRGTLYAQFTDGWMEGEAKRRRLDYDYARVKVPVLAYLAKRMTAAGQTVMRTSPELEEDLEKELAAIHKRIARIGGMPDHWKVLEFLNEVLCDGLLKDLGGQLQFLHQSVQEFYTALWFRDRQDALVEFTPRLVWDAIPRYGTVGLPEHRFVIPLLIVAGLKEASPLIRTLVDRHPVLAAAALASASQVDPALPTSLERSWRALLDEPNPKLRVGLGCVVASGRVTDSLLQRLLDIALEEKFERYYTAHEGLGALAATLVLPAVLRRAEAFGETEAESRPLERLADVVERFPAGVVVRALSPAWRAADQQTKERILQLRPQKLDIDRETLHDAERAFVDEQRPSRAPLGPTWGEQIRQAARRSTQEFRQTREQKIEELRSSDPTAVRASLTADSAAERSAAATVAAERQLPVFDDLVEMLLWTDRDSGRLDFIEALVSLGGGERAAAALSDRAKWAPRRIATLPLAFKTELRSGKLSEAAQSTLKALGVEVSGASVDDDGRSWALQPSSWSGRYRPSYEAREAGGGIELYDLNVPAKALQALLRLPDSEALRATLQTMLEDDALQDTVLELIEPSESSWMAQWLLERLKVAGTERFVHTALEALERLRAKEAVVLVDDLLLLGTDESPGTHPSWRPADAYPRYRRQVHAVLASLAADEAVFVRLDHGLNGVDAAVRRAAIAEYRRWLPDREHPSERLQEVMTAERVKQFAQMASDPDDGVREGAARVLLVVDPDVAESRCLRDLGHADAAVRAQAARVLQDARRGSSAVIAALDRALDDETVHVTLSAAASLVALAAEGVYARIRAKMSALATSTAPPDLRRRASAVLAQLPGATQPFYAPIQRALNEHRYEQAATLIDEALAIVPDDVELHWWAGHTHVALGQLEEARKSFERAGDLQPSISIIAQALADTLLKLGDANAALVPARKAVSLDQESTDARVVLAWALYQTGAYDEAAASAQLALDLDPISPEAAWILLLAGIRRRDWAGVDKTARHLRLLRTMLAPDLPTAPTDACSAEIATLRDLQPEVAQTLTELSA